jgi:segregation and condensation protein B
MSDTPAERAGAANDGDARVGTEYRASASDAPDRGCPENDDALTGHVVAILFAADGPLTLAELARLLEARPSAVQRVVRLLIDRPPPGLLVQRDQDRVQLVTAPASARHIRRLRGLDEQARLSRSALEVLAVIAYRQPATRAEIEAIRGVNGDRALATLLARGLVAEVGRRDTVGRPVLFGTTLGFLEHLGLRSLDDLPKPAPPDHDLPPADASSTSR